MSRRSHSETGTRMHREAHGKPVAPRKAKVKPHGPSEASILMEHHLREVFGNETVIVGEFTFHETRKWRFDYACLEHLLAIEIEGAIWTSGRHTRGSGYQKDLDKYNAATARGWKVFRFSTGDVMEGKDLEALRQWKTNTTRS